MTTDNSTRRGSRLQLILIALIFAVPLVAASWLYFADNAVKPAGTTNHGTLLEPILNLPDELGESALLLEAENRWALVYLQAGACEQDCADALFKQRQMRLMLGNDMSRVVRMLLRDPQAPATLPQELDPAGLKLVDDTVARQLLINVHPRDTSAAGFYLVDPLGNLVMYFPVDIGPRELVDDLERLLKLSRIG